MEARAAAWKTQALVSQPVLAMEVGVQTGQPIGELVGCSLSSSLAGACESAGTLRALEFTVAALQDEVKDVLETDASKEYLNVFRSTE
eukprot:6284065-Pyramimonas_sp.AAC.1